MLPLDDSSYTTTTAVDAADARIFQCSNNTTTDALHVQTAADAANAHCHQCCRHP